MAAPGGPAPHAVTPIEDYAMLSDCHSAALVSRHGDVDWWCPARFDSPSVFAALVGTAEQGRWSLRPRDAEARATRRYDGDTFILVTRWECASGVAEVHEFLIAADGRRDLVRRIVGIRGTVEFETELRLRFDYARAVPWMGQIGTDDAPALRAAGGPDRVVVRGIRLHAHERSHRGAFRTAPGETRDLTATWSHSYRPEPEPLDVDAAFEASREWWRQWAEHITHDGPYQQGVARSLLVLVALSHVETGGIVAAATTSLPEEFGGVRNWDYRYVWLRDAALTLEVLIDHGFLDAAERWRLWLLRAIAGDPADMQIMYGVAGERDLPERVLDHLPGYGGATPVRIGNGAVDQYQGDVVGEVMVALEEARLAGLRETEFSWPLQRALLQQTEANAERPDSGIWEIRGEPRMFTQSRAMMWAAFDRGIRAVEKSGLRGPVDRWRAMRDRLRAEIDAHGVDADGGYFVQYYGSHEVDASLLLLPQVGFCAADDPRMLATVARIEQTLVHEGMVFRYRTETGVDGVAGSEHPFVACTFWLVEQYAASGRRDDAVALMERASAAMSDLGLIAEQYDPVGRRQAGNTPQALSHLAFVRAADALGGHPGRAADRV